MEITTNGKWDTKYVCREKKECLQLILNRRRTKHSHRLCWDFSLRSQSILRFLPWDVSINSAMVFAVLGQKMATTYLELVVLNTCSAYTVYCSYTCQCCQWFPVGGVIIVFCHHGRSDPFMLCTWKWCTSPSSTQKSRGEEKSGLAVRQRVCGTFFRKQYRNQLKCGS